MTHPVHPTIKLRPLQFFQERGVDVPPVIWREAPFKFAPEPFGISSPKLEDRIFQASEQSNSLSAFLTDPYEPIVYGVGSAPSDAKAKLFAAYLTQKFLETAHPSNTVMWMTAGLFASSDKFKDAFHRTPSLLVLTGLSANSSSYKLDAVSELLDKHSNIPRIVVIAGEDPISFLYGRMAYHVHRIFFHNTSLAKRKVEVI